MRCFNEIKIKMSKRHMKTVERRAFSKDLPFCLIDMICFDKTKKHIILKRLIITCFFKNSHFFCKGIDALVNHTLIHHGTPLRIADFAIGGSLKFTVRDKDFGTKDRFKRYSLED